jgi:hypothetical protein
MLAALVVGGLTAWYLGLNAGIIAAIATAAALILSSMFGSMIPGLTLVVYVIVCGWCAALYFLGPKMSKGKGLKDDKAGQAGVLGNVMGAASGIGSWVKKQLGNDKKS